MANCTVWLRYLFGALALQAELAGDLAAGVLAAVEVHTPGAAEGEGRATGLRVPALARARPAAGGDRGRKAQTQKSQRRGDALKHSWSCDGETRCKQW